MLFNSLEFILAFLPLCLIAFQLSKAYLNRKHVLAVLIIASLIFYAYWNPYYLSLLIFSILFNYVIGQKLYKTSDKFLAVFGITSNLLILAYFKYTNFFIDSINTLTNSQISWVEILLPLGISFFTFQQISYLVECYKKNIYSVDFLEYCLFVSFFPQLIAGPIVRFNEITPQFSEAFKKETNWAMLYTGLVLFCIGLFKKVLIANSTSIEANNIFGLADTGFDLTAAQAWSGLLSYSFQIYFDFSAYSDMAIGLGLMLGLRLPENFLSPYRAKNISDFWRRWHITLSRFLRDYIYIPLGGNRKSTQHTMLNLFIVMTLGGLWHGAHWNFVIWGALHGCYLILYHVYSKIIKNSTSPNFLTTKTKILLTFILVTLTWAFFRAETYSGAINILKSALDFSDNEWSFNSIFITSVSPLWYCFILIWLCPNSIELSKKIEIITKDNQKIFLLTCTSFFSATLLSMSVFALFTGLKSEFIYFQF